MKQEVWILFGILSSIMKYIFITIIYLFIFSVIRLIYLDIKSMDAQGRQKGRNFPYLKLINRRENLDFKVEETYILDGNVELGRSSKNNIIIRDPYISSSHAKLTQNEGEYFVQDLGSTNGTFVNGEKIGTVPVQLKNGDKIHVGQVYFLFVNNK